MRGAEALPPLRLAGAAGVAAAVAARRFRAGALALARTFSGVIV
jgi:hypothetical protein